MNVAVQSSSQSWPVERREPDARLGKMCVVFAFSLSPGMWSCPVWVARMVALLGKSTVMPLDVGFTSVIGTFVWMYLSVTAVASKQCVVAPVSATTGFIIGWAGTVRFIFCLLTVCPMSQLCGLQACIEFVLPPNLFCNVAASLRSSHLLEQVLLLCCKFCVMPCV